jgi:hypothetical protein
MRRTTERASLELSGKSFQIEAFDEAGYAELDLTRR